MSDRSTPTFVRDASHSVVVPGSRVVRSAEVAHVGGKPVTPKQSPTIELVKEDDIVRAIDITCECGQKIRLWCSYETPGENQQLAEISDVIAKLVQ